MASLSSDPNGNRTVQFVDSDDRRRSIRLGKLNKRQAEAVKRHIEQLVFSKSTGTAPHDETSRWLAGIDDKLRERLARVGLVPKLKKALLGPFVADYIARRQSVVKPSTITRMKQAERLIVEFLGENKPLREVTEGEVEDFRDWLLGKKNLAEATTRKRCSDARVWFRYAVKHMGTLKNRKPIGIQPLREAASGCFVRAIEVFQ